MTSTRERPQSFQSALKAAREILSGSEEVASKGSIEAEVEQLVLAAYRMETGRLLSRLEFFSRASDPFPEGAWNRLLLLAQGRAEGKSLQHLTGVQVFLDHEYEVGPDVLIPRPETEILVSEALECLRKIIPAPRLGLEIGLGSGAISVELLSALPGLEMVGSELTDAAALRARSNASRILGEQVNRLKIIRAGTPVEVWEPFERELPRGTLADFVISNPPYLGDEDPIEAEVRRNEPATALFAPPEDLLYFYRAIALEAHRFLRSGASAFMEIAPERSQEVLSLFVAQNWEARILKDLAGRDRLLVATLSEKR